MSAIMRASQRVGFFVLALLLIFPAWAAAGGVTPQPVNTLRARMVTEGGVPRVMLTYQLPRVDGQTVRVFSNTDGYVSNPEEPFGFDSSFGEDKGVLFRDRSTTKEHPIMYFTVFVKYASGWSAPATAAVTHYEEPIGARDEIPGMPMPDSPFAGSVYSSVQDPMTGDGLELDHEVWRVDLARGQLFAAEFYMLENNPYAFLKKPPSWVFDMYPPGTTSIATASSARASAAAGANGASPLTTFRYIAPVTGTYYFVVRIPKKYVQGSSQDYAIRWWRGSRHALKVRLTKVWFHKYASGARVIRYKAVVTPADAPFSMYVWPNGWWPRSGKAQRWTGKKWVQGDQGIVKVKDGGVISGQFYAPKSRKVKVRLVIPAVGLYSGATSNTKTAKR
ncbi:MAG TPA: hypothetical protein VFG89_01440 [Coriobacteriia bacterium]|nr:hypothetical protein [Coriobacteriia bacterium]